MSNPSFEAGIAWALAEVWRLHHEDVVIRDVLQGTGLTVADLRRYGAAAEDLTAIRKALGGLE